VRALDLESCLFRQTQESGKVRCCCRQACALNLLWNELLLSLLGMAAAGLVHLGLAELLLVAVMSCFGDKAFAIAQHTLRSACKWRCCAFAYASNC
jgi:predicted membrane-bound spermidine synthase